MPRRRALSLALGAIVLLLPGCTPGGDEGDEVAVVAFDQLSPARQQVLRLEHGPEIDQRWAAIVRAACKRSTAVNCVCCQASTKQHADGSSCAFPAPCACPAPAAAAPAQ